MGKVKSELIIAGLDGGSIKPEAQTVERVVIRDCFDADIDLSQISFVNSLEHNIPLVDIHPTAKACGIDQVCHQNIWIDWIDKKWNYARRGVVDRGECNVISRVNLAGVRFGLELMGIGSEAKQVRVGGFCMDAIRINASGVLLDDFQVFDSIPFDERNHNDGVQLFPLASPKDQAGETLKGVTVKNGYLENNSQANNYPHTWMQGVILTDGKIKDSRFENLIVRTDQEHGLTLAEAYDVDIDKVSCRNPWTPDKTPCCISVNTKKPDYEASRRVRLIRPDADEVRIA